MLPTGTDYARLEQERGHRLAHVVRLEAPLALKAARQAQAEQRVMLGGAFGVSLAIETVEELESTTVAFKAGTVASQHVPEILAAFHADTDWVDAKRMPSRELEADEFAFEHIH